MERLKTYKQLFENNTIIKYISNGMDNNCPVYGTDSVDVMDVKGSYEHNECRICEFEWDIYYEYVFVFSDAYNNSAHIEKIEVGKDIDKEVFTNQQEFNDDWNPSLRYLNNGKDDCPYCGNDDVDVYDSNSTDEEESFSVFCQRCFLEWVVYNNKVYDKSYDINMEMIKKNNIVDEELFNINLYNKYIKQQTIKEFNI